ncbi:MAG TPA: SDR family oxidoreductase [Armatimonadota bacterium]|nr:SDR family oxidoreductase [Armatimonadota bacterium]
MSSDPRGNKLAGMVALVTGGGRGIGRAIAIAYANEGADVAVCARSAGELDRVVEQIEARGRRGAALVGDLANPRDAERIASCAAAALGPIDVLVNNAGVFWTRPFIESTADELDRMLAVNVRGPFAMMKAVLPAMLERDSGIIINVASLAGQKGYEEQSAYCASKHALLGMTKALALELAGTGVRVSALSPGGVDTTLIAQARPELDRTTWMDADDVAQLAVLLASLPPKMAIDEITVRRRAAAPTSFR